jgi:hypothetical protein
MSETRKYYNENVKKAIDNYREKNREKYNEYCSNYLKQKMQDPEWAEKKKHKMNEYNKAYQKQKRLERIANGYVPRPRGRPRKIVEEDLGEIENCKVIFGDS